MEWGSGVADGLWWDMCILCTYRYRHRVSKHARKEGRKKERERLQQWRINLSKSVWLVQLKVTIVVNGTCEVLSECNARHQLVTVQEHQVSKLKVVKFISF